MKRPKGRPRPGATGSTWTLPASGTRSASNFRRATRRATSGGRCSSWRGTSIRRDYLEEGDLRSRQRRRDRHLVLSWLAARISGTLRAPRHQHSGIRPRRDSSRPAVPVRHACVERHRGRKRGVHTGGRRAGPDPLRDRWDGKIRRGDGRGATGLSRLEHDDAARDRTAPNFRFKFRHRFPGSGWGPRLNAGDKRRLEDFDG